MGIHLFLGGRFFPVLLQINLFLDGNDLLDFVARKIQENEGERKSLTVFKKFVAHLVFI